MKKNVFQINFDFFDYMEHILNNIYKIHLFECSLFEVMIHDIRTAS